MGARNQFEADNRAKRVAKLVPIITRALPPGLTSKTVGTALRGIKNEDWERAGVIAGFTRPPSVETIACAILAIEADYEFAEELETSPDFELPSDSVAPLSGVVWH
jgi:hypothetical protein